MFSKNKAIKLHRVLIQGQRKVQSLTYAIVLEYISLTSQSSLPLTQIVSTLNQRVYQNNQSNAFFKSLNADTYLQLFLICV